MPQLVCSTVNPQSLLQQSTSCCYILQLLAIHPTHTAARVIQRPILKVEAPINAMPPSGVHWGFCHVHWPQWVGYLSRLITEHMTTMNEKAAIIGFENHNRVVLWLGLLLCQNALYVGKSNWL